MKILSYSLPKLKAVLVANQIKLLSSGRSKIHFGGVSCPCSNPVSFLPDPILLKNAKNMSTKSLEAVPKVDIDPNGVFKYILVKVYDKAQNDQEPSITVVRGYQRCDYHSDIYDEVQEQLKPLDCEPLGGGRISHEPDNKKIHIYGYSQGYGKADHEEAAKLIKDAYPGYTISVSDEGY